MSFALISMLVTGQKSVWSPDVDALNYRNPIVFADYSDPDLIGVGEDYYMTASSFSQIPGLPVLHSTDLVHWTLITHAIQKYPDTILDRPSHGNAVWAPSIRYHKGEFYIYFGDPDRGIFMTKSKNPAGPWSELKLVKKALGWIDCCPLWDEDGKTYLAHAYANSRAGIKSKLAICEMNQQGDSVIGKDSIVFDGTIDHPTLEGAKIYKRDSWYYMLAPAGGVKPGWQVAFRSKNVYGPYEDKIVLEQGSTDINGPHQGGWVTTPRGEDWFIHFQDRYAYGRILHLNPVHWKDGWPMMGVDYDGNGIGEPVRVYPKPKTNKPMPGVTPQESDDFTSPDLGLQWQWESNFQSSWYKLVPENGPVSAHLDLYPQPFHASDLNLWSVGNLLMQKFPAGDFISETYLDASQLKEGNKAGLIVFGYDYMYVSLRKDKKGYTLQSFDCYKAKEGKPEKMQGEMPLAVGKIWLRVHIYPADPSEIIPDVKAQFSYSTDGVHYSDFGKVFNAKEGHWVGGKVGIFALSDPDRKTGGLASFSYFRFSH